MPRTTWGPLSTDEQNSIEFAPVGEPGVLVAGTAGGLLKRNADGTMGNSILSESGSVLTAAGSLRFSLTTEAGLRFNNLTTTQRNALTAGAGDAVWNTTTTRLNIHNGSAWTDGFVRLAGDTMTGSLSLASGTTLNWNSDTILQRDAAGKVSLRNLANAQTFEVYGTTDAGLTNYRRIRTTMTTGGAATIAAEGLGTGVSGNSLALAVNGTSRLTINAAGNISIDASVTFGNVRNVTYSTIGGTKHGTSTTEKIGFWNATPIVQPSGTGETSGFTAGAGTPVTDASTFTGNVGATAYRLSDIVKALKSSGLMAS